MILHPGGTRFRLFPQYDEGFAPEVIRVSAPPGSLRPGPASHAMIVRDAVDKAEPYAPPSYQPPYRGAVHAPAMPDDAGNFDAIPLDTPQFMAAHLFGTVRHTLDIWEWYLDRHVAWWHAAEHPQLELVPVVRWRNAQSGPGFLETGIWPATDGTPQPFCLNYDIVAHETGHTVMFGIMGVPPPDEIEAPFLAFHESFADLVALIGSLHFTSVRHRLLEQTGGNLYVLNLVSRLGETGAHQQIRIASNLATMDDVAGICLTVDGDWLDPLGLGRNAHAVADPLTGAVFDVMVEIYQDALATGGLIPPDSDARGWTRPEVEAAFAAVQGKTARAYARFSAGFEAALESARDAVGRAMAHVMLTLPPATLTFDRVAARFLEGLLLQGFGAMAPALIDHFLWRGIDPAPFLRLAPVPAPQSIRRPMRRAPMLRVVAAPARPACGCDSGHAIFARRLLPHGHRAM